MIQLRDWTALASRRQPLRVSNPAPGTEQTSTYRLSLPYKYSLTLLASSTFLNWVVSQGLFFYRYKIFNDAGDDIQKGYWDAGFGYSGVGVLCIMIFAGIIFVASVVVGAQSCEPGLPLGASNSLVISAACHPPEEDRDAGEKIMQWGVVPSARDRIPHCCLTSREVEMPVAGRLYT